MLARANERLSEDDVALIQALVDKDALLTTLLQQQGTKLKRLRRLFGIPCSERTRDVFPDAETNGSSAKTDNDPSGSTPSVGSDGATQSADAGATQSADGGATQSADGGGATQSSDDGGTPATDTPGNDAGSTTNETKTATGTGHGRIAASEYVNAEHIPVPHDTLSPRDLCPACSKGKLYRLKTPAPILRVVGNAPLVATCYDCERLRCATCGHLFTARAPAEAQNGKYDETAVAMIALLHYGAGMPLHRLARLQDHLQTPVPTSTQWDLIDAHGELVQPVYDELVHVAAQGEVLHHDDSYVRILEFMGKRRAALVANGALPAPERTGLFTTAVVSIIAGVGRIAVLFSGRRHAGENLDDVLAHRCPELSPPIAMSDALNRNVPQNHPVVEANCIAHGRRRIVDEADNYPEECRFVLQQLATVYRLDHELNELGVSDDLRLLAHRYYSGPVMDELQTYMKTLLDEKQIEPNCGLGQAFTYFLKRWDKLTCFLREPGGPLDNNIAERTLKTPIKHRKASLFYRSQRGAHLGDIFMTLILTSELHGINPYDYLTALLKHPKAVAERPWDWLPWTYQHTLLELAAATAA